MIFGQIGVFYFQCFPSNLIEWPLPMGFERFNFKTFAFIQIMYASGSFDAQFMSQEPVVKIG